MIELYAWPTPNSYKISILLEELGLSYRVVPINIMAGDQFTPDFLKISPNNKMPAIVDPDGPGGEPYALFESGAIMMYLADKHGAFLPQDKRGYFDVVQWLMFQMGGVGPMLGQAHHFRQYAPEQIDYAIKRYTNEATRLYTVINTRLGVVEFLAGAYSIADMAVFPWLRSYERQGQKIEDFPNLKRWMDTLNARPAVQRGLTLMAEQQGGTAKMDDNARSIMFGDKQVQRKA